METSNSPTSLKLKHKRCVNGSVNADDHPASDEDVSKPSEDFPDSPSHESDGKNHSHENGCADEDHGSETEMDTTNSPAVVNNVNDCNGKPGSPYEESEAVCDKLESPSGEKPVESENIVSEDPACDSVEEEDVNCVPKEKLSDDVCDRDEKHDSEKENKEAQDGSEDHTSEKVLTSSKMEATPDCKSSAVNDDVQIIGESKVVQINNPSSSPQNLILMQTMIPANVALPVMPAGFSASSSSLLTSANLPNNMLVPMQSTMAGGMPNMNSGFLLAGGIQANGTQSPNAAGVMPSSVAPPKPKSSLDQIELIRWEIQNRINTRPKYFKPNPSAELGPLAKFLFDIGSDLIKESVYHELVKIQAKKNEDDKLTAKEKDDLEKLKEIEKDLHDTIGHLKLRMKKRCRTCNFQTESNNVLYNHKQYPHEDNKSLHCSYCPFTTKQVMNFKFHMETEHNIQARIHDKKAFYECDLCPYENNQEQKLTMHKQRCLKQFRPLFNLHPSCLSGAEINLCLENIFYKPIVPKNFKILQQKHIQQQAALAEARRQHAQVQALATQKNMAAMAKRQTRQPSSITPRFVPPQHSPNRQTFPRPPTATSTPVRYNARQQVRNNRPTVANMLKDKQSTRNSPAGYHHATHGQTPGGFEVCEICGGYVKDRKALRIHFFYAHRIDLPFNLFDRSQPPLYCATCYVRFWTAQGLRKHIDVHAPEQRAASSGAATGGVSGKCISCGHLVDNIVVHMRVVHMREIHHYVNALMCIFCGASFSSRQAVETHIDSVHGIIDRNTGAVKYPAKAHNQSSKHSSSQKKSSGSNNSLVKGSVCVLCNLNFGRNVDLTRHCMRMHHTCMKCGMVVIDKPSLLKHTCLSSATGTRDCTMCGEAGFHPAYYVKHLRDKHLKKFSIKVAKVSPPVVEKWTKRPFPYKEKEEVLEISDSEDDEVIISTPAPKIVPGQPPKKKVKVGPACKMRNYWLSNGVEDITSKLADGCGEKLKAGPSSKRRSFDGFISEKTPTKRKRIA